MNDIIYEKVLRTFGLNITNGKHLIKSTVISYAYSFNVFSIEHDT